MGCLDGYLPEGEFASFTLGQSVNLFQDRTHEIDLLMKKRSNQPVWLTAREQELLRLIVDGYTNQEIADKMFLSIETIKTYRKNLIQKLGAKNSMVLVKIAMEEKWV